MNYYLYNSVGYKKGEIKDLKNKFFDKNNKYSSIGIDKDGYSLDVIIKEGEKVRISLDYKQSKIFNEKEVAKLVTIFESETGLSIN